MSRIGIIDYGMGNLKSVGNAVERVGGKPVAIDTPDTLDRYDRLILPGVGAFPEAIANLEAKGMNQALHEFVIRGAPILGICLGMQLMCRCSYEGGHHEGLGWLDFEVVKFASIGDMSVPQIGWNTVLQEQEHKIFTGINKSFDVYFLHSYYAKLTHDAGVLGSTEYGVRYASVIGRNNIVAMQFHPEKSSNVGMILLSNFLNWSPN